MAGDLNHIASFQFHFILTLSAFLQSPHFLVRHLFHLVHFHNLVGGIDLRTEDAGDKMMRGFAVPADKGHLPICFFVRHHLG